MTSKHLFTSAIATLACSFTALAEISVKPAGMRIVWDSLRKELDFPTYNANDAVSFSFALTTDGKSFIAYNKDDSDITVKAGDQDLEGEFQSWEKISKDGKTMRLEVATEKLPEGQAGKFELSGSIEVLLASKMETKSTELKAFKKGDKVTFGDDFSFEVKDLAKPAYGDDELEISLEWKHDISDLAEVRFYDAEGKIIKSRKGGSSSFGAFGKTTITHSYLLKKKSDTIKIEMDLWADIEKVKVPLKMNMGLSGAVE